MFNISNFGVHRGSNTECDTSAGNKYMRSSPGKDSNLEECKQSCQGTTGCQSFTIYISGWCSHFSTLCVKTKWNTKTNAYRYGEMSDILSTSVFLIRNTVSPTVGATVQTAKVCCFCDVETVGNNFVEHSTGNLGTRTVHMGCRKTTLC